MSDNIIQRLPAITIQLSRIILSIQLIVGTFGNIMNILVFTRRSLRSNPCSIYFLASSIGNILFIYVSLLTRLLASGWQIDPTNTNAALCKLRVYFVFIFLCLVQWFTVLASIDRYLSSSRSVRLRELSSIPMARKTITLTISLIFLIHFHTLVWYTTDYIGTSLYCFSFMRTYAIAFSIFFLIVTCLLPPILMGTFGILTILNVRKIRIQVVPQGNNARNERLHTKDRQLIKMLLVQVIVSIICTAPFSIDTIFNAAVANQVRSVSYMTINTFVDNLARFFIYFIPVVGFFIYTLAGPIFRTETKCIILEAMKFVQTKFGPERYIPRAGQQQSRQITMEIPMSMVTTKNRNNLSMTQEQVKETSRA